MVHEAISTYTCKQTAHSAGCIVLGGVHLNLSDLCLSGAARLLVLFDGSIAQVLRLVFGIIDGAECRIQLGASLVGGPLGRCRLLVR